MSFLDNFRDPAERTPARNTAADGTMASRSAEPASRPAARQRGAEAEHQRLAEADRQPPRADDSQHPRVAASRAALAPILILLITNAIVGVYFWVPELFASIPAGLVLSQLGPLILPMATGWEVLTSTQAPPGSVFSWLLLAGAILLALGCRNGARYWLLAWPGAALVVTGAVAAIVSTVAGGRWLAGAVGIGLAAVSALASVAAAKVRQVSPTRAPVKDPLWRSAAVWMSLLILPALATGRACLSAVPWATLTEAGSLSTDQVHLTTEGEYVLQTLMGVSAIFASYAVIGFLPPWSRRPWVSWLVWLVILAGGGVLVIGWVVYASAV